MYIFTYYVPYTGRPNLFICRLFFMVRTFFVHQLKTNCIKYVTKTRHKRREGHKISYK